MLAGDREAAIESLESVGPRLGVMPENFMGGFGLVGFTEAALAVDHQELLIEVRSVLSAGFDDG